MAEDKTNFALIAIVAIVAIIALVVLFKGTGTTKTVIVPTESAAVDVEGVNVAGLASSIDCNEIQDEIRNIYDQVGTVSIEREKGLRRYAGMLFRAADSAGCFN